MADFFGFWHRALAYGFGAARRAMKNPLAGAAVVIVGALIFLFLGDPILRLIHLPEPEVGAAREIGKAVAKLIATGCVGLLALLAISVFLAPVHLWKIERQKAAGFPYGAEKPLFEVTSCHAQQPIGLARYWEVIAELRMARDVSEASLRVWASDYAYQSHSILAERITKMRGETVRLNLAAIAMFDDHQHAGVHFGGLDGPQFPENHPVLLRIEMTEKGASQECRVVLAALRTPNEQRQAMVI
ncbi:MAG: hypothetical protein ACOVOE_00830 [Caulobacter sp.]